MSYDAVIFTESGTSFYTKTLGAYRIASMLREEFNWRVLVIDHFTFSQIYLKHEFDTLLKKVLDANIKFIGFSTSFMNFANVEVAAEAKRQAMVDKVYPVNHSIKGYVECLPFLKIEAANAFFQELKILAPNAKLVIGGNKTENRPYDKFIDAYVLGYGESQLIDLINYYEGKNHFMVKKFHPNNSSCLIIEHDTKADRYDFSSKSSKFCKDDWVLKGETLPYEIARGCIFKCKFCAFPLNGKKKRDYIKDPKIIREDFIHNYNEYGTVNYIIVDDTFNDTVPKLEVFADLVSSLPFNITYSAYLRHDLIHSHPEMIPLLRNSGLVSATFGIETLNHASGKAIGKGLHPAKTIALLHKLKQDWPKTTLFSGFILGLPFDTLDSINKMVEQVLDPTFPLDSFQFTPLGMLKDAHKTKLYSSEFEKDYAKWGYVFPEGTQHRWRLNDLSYDQCNTIAMEARSKSLHSQRVKVGAFLFSAALGLGYTVDELLVMPELMLYKDAIKIRYATTKSYLDAQYYAHN